MKPKKSWAVFQEGRIMDIDGRPALYRSKKYAESQRQFEASPIKSSKVVQVYTSRENPKDTILSTYDSIIEAMERNEQKNPFWQYTAEEIIKWLKRQKSLLLIPYRPI